MRMSLRIVLSIVALSMAFGGALQAPAQERPIAGGYAKTSGSSPEVVAAARYAVREQGLKQGSLIFLDSIRGAEVQVVSGLNYRLSLRVRDDRKAQDVTVVVYKNLKREYSLSSWEVVANLPDNAAGIGAVYSDSAIEQLIKALDEAYAARALGRLDAKRPYFRRVRIVIAHSIAEDAKDEIKAFTSLAQAERWLRSREISENLPFRATRPLEECKGGICTYDFNGGILHNHLYLQQVTYGMRNGRPYLKTIFLLDGD